MLGALAPLPRELTRLELLDQPGAPRVELAACLVDIARLNRLGPIQSLVAHVAPFFARFDPGTARPLRILDLGTGGADIPVALARWACARGHAVSVLGLDVQPEIVACARLTTRGVPQVRLVAGEALTPPVRPASVDVAICSLMLHHLPEDAVIRVLRSMASVARLGFVVSDLRRSRLAYAAAWVATRVISKNRMTRHDGPLSVRRAYTRAELTRLSAAAGLPEVRWYHALPFRVIGVYRSHAR